MNELETPLCPGCGAHWTGKAHCILECPGWSDCRNELLNADPNGIISELVLAGDKYSARDILLPHIWNATVNKNIDTFCTKFVARSNNLILSKTQPDLAALIDPNDIPKLNENIENEVFDIDYEEGFFRARVVSYDPISGLFEVDSQGLDLCNNNGVWTPFTQGGVDLNAMFDNNQLQHLSDYLQFDHELLDQGVALHDNITGCNVSVKINRRWKNCLINFYDSERKLHNVTFASPKRTEEIDLNGRLSVGQLRINIAGNSAPHVLAHASAFLQSRPLSRESDALNGIMVD